MKLVMQHALAFLLSTAATIGFADSSPIKDSRELSYGVSTYPSYMSCNGFGELFIKASIDKETSFPHSGSFRRREGSLENCITTMTELMEAGKLRYSFVQAHLKVDIKYSQARCEVRIDSPMCDYATETATLSILGHEFESVSWNLIGTISAKKTPQ